jgi:hypothetical protein
MSLEKESNMAKHLTLSEADEALIRQIQTGMFVTKDAILNAKDAGQGLIGYYNGQGDGGAVRGACDAMEALTELERAYRACHNRLSRELVDIYGPAQADKIIISTTKGGGGGR